MKFTDLATEYINYSNEVKALEDNLAHLTLSKVNVLLANEVEYYLSRLNKFNDELTCAKRNLIGVEKGLLSIFDKIGNDKIVQFFYGDWGCEYFFSISNDGETRAIKV